MADDATVLAQLSAILGALQAAGQLEATTPRQIYASVSEALGGVKLSAAVKAKMEVEMNAFLVRLTQSQSGGAAAAEEEPRKRMRKAAAPRRRKAASSGDDDEEEESEPSAAASEGDEEASESDFEETSEDDEGEPWRKKKKSKKAAPPPKKRTTPVAKPKAATAKASKGRASDAAAAGAAAAAAAAAVAAARGGATPAPAPAQGAAAGAGAAAPAVAAPSSQLAVRIAAALLAAPEGLSAPELGAKLGVGKSEVNSAVYKMAAAKTARKEQGSMGPPKWHATDATAALAAAAGAEGDAAAAHVPVAAPAAAAAPKPAAAAPAAGGGDVDGVQVADLGANRRVTVSKFRGASYVSLREFYEKDGEWRPGKRGISLPEEQWRAVMAARDLVDAAVAAISPPEQ